MMELAIGMIAKVVLPNNIHHSNTSRHYGINEEMGRLNYVLITEMTSPTCIKGAGIEIVGDTYTLIPLSWGSVWDWYAYDLRPTTLANKLRRIE